MPEHDGVTFETWRQKADDDFSAATILSEHSGPAATICFLCQQAAEKYLKGYLLLRGRPLKRIHQLDALLEDCTTLDESFQCLVEDAVLLKEYYITSRYPADLVREVSKEEGAAAITAASRIRGFVLGRVESAEPKS